MKQVILTYDVEDFVNKASNKAIARVASELDKNELKAVFFITGHKAEELVKNKSLTSKLRNHSIGYHSSSHSVRPIIHEFTDLEDYSEAVEESLKRETRHINPLTGKPERTGGIHAVEKLGEVECFRAPGYSWTPPHLDALKELGIKHDFSSKLGKEPFRFKRVNHYPFPVPKKQPRFGLSVLTRNTIVLDWHPSGLVGESWDQNYYQGNPLKLEKTRTFPEAVIKRNFEEHAVMLRKVKQMIENNKAVNPDKLKDIKAGLPKIDYAKEYERTLYWARKYFSYEPKHLKNHFRSYFAED